MFTKWLWSAPHLFSFDGNREDADNHADTDADADADTDAIFGAFNQKLPFFSF